MKDDRETKGFREECEAFFGGQGLQPTALNTTINQSSSSIKRILHGVNDSKSIAKYLREAISVLLTRSTEGEERCFTVEDLTRLWTGLGGDSDVPPRWIEDWSKRGDVYSPKAGFYRFT